MPRLLAVTLLLLSVTLLLPSGVRAQTDAERLEAWRERLAGIAPGAWVASSAT